MATIRKHGMTDELRPLSVADDIEAQGALPMARSPSIAALVVIVIAVVVLVLWWSAA
jgi:hypothetical protein